MWWRKTGKLTLLLYLAEYILLQLYDQGSKSVVMLFLLSLLHAPLLKGEPPGLKAVKIIAV